jgi:hypothetical protein
VVRGTNWLFRDAEKRCTLQNAIRKPLFLNRYFCFEKPFYTAPSAKSQT